MPDRTEITAVDTAHPFSPLPVDHPDSLARLDSPSALQALQAALARPGPSLRFDRDLEQAYEQDTGAGRGQRIFFCNLLGTAVFGLLATIDIEKLSHAAATLEPLRNAVLVFCCLGLLWHWMHFRHISARDREGLTAIGTVAMSVYVAVESHEARDVLGVMIGSHMMTIFVFSCVVMRLQFPVAVVVNLAAVLAYALAASAFDSLTDAIVRNYLVLFATAAFISLSGNYLLERKERRAYLMQRLSVLHRDAVQTRAEVLRKLTLRDPLTGLANRRHFDREIGELWRAGPLPGASVGLLQIDVDFFKRYNDTYGHPMGDLCLQRLGGCLIDVARAHGGLAARIGGEEFAVLLPGLALDAANAVAQRLCETIRALKIPHVDSSAAAFVTISVGVAAMRPAEASHPVALMRAADLALYRAKHEGRNRFAAAQASADAIDAIDPLAPIAPLAPLDPLDASSLAQVAEDTPPGGSALPAANVGDRVRQWSELLAAERPRLRFPPKIESDYQERQSLKRQRSLAALLFAGLIVTCGFVWMSLPLHADIAPAPLYNTFVLCGAIALPWAAVLRRSIPWRRREWLLSITASLLLLGLLAIGAQSQSPGMQSSLISLSLIMIVSAVLAMPPTGLALPPLILLVAAMATLTWRSAPADLARWVEALSLLSTTAIYSLVGAYSLDLFNRRNYLLRRLGEAQLAQMQEINANLQRLALTDTLTGLPNRRHFESQLSAFWEESRSTDAPLAMLIIDIDHFKLYNDHCGHLAGDACLQSVGAFIAQWCAQRRAEEGRPVAAFAARLGGEEFGVLLPGHSAQAPLAAAAQLCAALHARRSPHAHSPVSDVLTASIGVASQRPAGAAELRQLLRVADEALYRAKAGGRNRACV